MAATLIDDGSEDEFFIRVLRDIRGCTSALLAAVGDRLGLFRTLAEYGPTTSAELASRASVSEPHVHEWLSGMANAGYIDYDPPSRRFTLPRQHAPVLAYEPGRLFMGGGYQMLMGVMPVVGLLIDAFRTGERIPQSAYPEDWWQGMERSSLGWIEDCLVQEWIPAMPAVEKALVVGADVADVGCGRGQCLIKLAVAYPNSRFVGYDHFAPGIERANQLAAEYGVADRLHFEFRDASAGIPGQFDVITTFDVIHDGVDPSQLLREIRGALRPGGTFVCLDANCSERLAQNHAPSGVFLHGLSVLYCLNTSLAEGGAGLGTLGVHERSMLRELCTASGFSNVRHVPINNPLKILYEVSTPVSEFTASPTATHAVSYDPRISGHPTRSITGRDEDTW